MLSSQCNLKEFWLKESVLELPPFEMGTTKPSCLKKVVLQKAQFNIFDYFDATRVEELHANIEMNKDEIDQVLSQRERLDRIVLTTYIGSFNLFKIISNAGFTKYFKTIELFFSNEGKKNEEQKQEEKSSVHVKLSQIMYSGVLEKAHTTRIELRAPLLLDLMINGFECDSIYPETSRYGLVDANHFITKLNLPFSGQPELLEINNLSLASFKAQRGNKFSLHIQCQVTQNILIIQSTGIIGILK
jgi:hypothetical protein